MKNNKSITILYFLASIGFYISSILNFINSDNSMGVVYFCLGSAFLCLGSVYLSSKQKATKSARLLAKIEQKTKYDLVKKTKRDNFAVLNQTVCEAGQVVLFGDSITEIFNVTDLFFDYTRKSGLAVYNRGISGDTSNRLAERLRDNVLNIRPSLLVILIGTNDIGLESPIDFIVSNIDKILSTVLKECPETRIILEAVYPVNRPMSADSRAMVGARKNSEICALNKKLRQTAEKHGIVFADFTKELSDENGRFLNKYTYDGLHPNAVGFKRITELLLPLLEQNI